MTPAMRPPTSAPANAIRIVVKWIGAVEVHDRGHRAGRRLTDHVAQGGGAHRQSRRGDREARAHGGYHRADSGPDRHPYQTAD